MEVRSSARKSTIVVRDARPGDRDNPNQVRRGSPLATPDAHALRSGLTACG